MKKSVMESLHTYLNAQTNCPAELLNAINEEYERGAEKARANVTLYDTAHDVAMEVMGDTPMTSKEIYTASNEWPEGFTQGKLNYALRVSWADEVERHENGKNPLTYTRK